MTENKKFRLKYLHDEMNLKSPAFDFQCYHYHKVVFFIFELVLKCYFSFAKLESHSEPSPTTKMEILWENRYRRKAGN